MYRFILPILAEYADAGYRDPKGRLMFSLRANAQYQALILGAGVAGGIYVFIYAGWSFYSGKVYCQCKVPVLTRTLLS